MGRTECANGRGRRQSLSNKLWNEFKIAFDTGGLSWEKSVYWPNRLRTLSCLMEAFKQGKVAPGQFAMSSGFISIRVPLPFLQQQSPVIVSRGHRRSPQKCGHMDRRQNPLLTGRCIPPRALI